MLNESGKLVNVGFAVGSDGYIVPLYFDGNYTDGVGCGDLVFVDDLGVHVISEVPVVHDAKDTERNLIELTPQLCRALTHNADAIASFAASDSSGNLRIGIVDDSGVLTLNDENRELETVSGNFYPDDIDDEEDSDFEEYMTVISQM